MTEEERADVEELAEYIANSFTATVDYIKKDSINNGKNVTDAFRDLIVKFAEMAER